MDALAAFIHEAWAGMNALASDAQRLPNRPGWPVAKESCIDDAIHRKRQAVHEPQRVENDGHRGAWHDSGRATDATAWCMHVGE